jgi:hypothetical protein
MRDGGISLSGLQQATGISRDTLIHYTSSGAPPEKKWTTEADNILRQLYPAREEVPVIAECVNLMLCRTDITERAVRVRIGQLKILKAGSLSEAEAEIIRETWARWKTERQSAHRSEDREPLTDHG